MKRSLIVALAVALTATFTATAAPAFLRTFTSRDGGFQISVSSTPKEETQSLKIGFATIPLKTFSGDLGGDGIYAVAYADFPRGAAAQAGADKVLDGCITGVASRGTLLSSKKISLGFYPGREADVEILGGKATLRVRVYLVNDRLYQVMAGTPKGQINSLTVSSFLDSFKR
jgi:hypothetical protein